MPRRVTVFLVGLLCTLIPLAVSAEGVPDQAVMVGELTRWCEDARMEGRNGADWVECYQMDMYRIYQLDDYFTRFVMSSPSGNSGCISFVIPDGLEGTVWARDLEINDHPYARMSVDEFRDKDTEEGTYWCATEMILRWKD